MKNIRADVAQSALKAKSECRDRIELLRSRIGLLGGKDRLLMTMYLNNGNTFYQIAKLAGVNETTVARRVRRITKRLIDGEYITCLRNRRKFTRAEIDVARDYFLAGLSIKKIAEKRSTSIYGVRQTLKKVRSCEKIVRS